MDNLATTFTIGHHDSKRQLPVTADFIAQVHAANYDLVTSSITTPYFHSRVLASLSDFLSASTTADSEDVTSCFNASPVHIAPLTPADTYLTPDDPVNQTIAIASSWIDLGSPDPIIADISRQILRLELTYAAFCGLTYVLVPGPKLRGTGAGGYDTVQYARAILEALSYGPYMQIYIWLPFIDHADGATAAVGDLTLFSRPQYSSHDGTDSDTQRLDVFGTWQAWDTIRTVCSYSTRLCVALSIPKLMPPTPIQSRWFSEPVRLLTMDTNSFTKNPKGYPVLSKAHQALVTRFVHFRQPPVWFLLCDVAPILGATHETVFPTPAESSSNTRYKDPTPHLSYMRNLQTKSPNLSPAERFGAGYQDYLQAPLQPLTVNLESVTYEVFEKDPIKYEWYERAIARALHDWIEQGKPTSNPDGRVVVAVVGAGRGPLVTRALQASEAVGVEIDMWALEKNPNAFVLLQRHNATKWDNRVSLVKSDMRTWRGPVRQANAAQIKRSFNLDPDDTEPGYADPGQTTPQTSTAFTGSSETDQNYLLATAEHQTTYSKIDILISELLGSFADNELSPECLDGVQHLLNTTHGISIPASYTAHLTPIAAPKLHADISLTMTSTVPHAAETPYVVMFNAIDFLSTSQMPSPQRSMGSPKTSGPSAPLSSNPVHQPTYPDAARNAAAAAANNTSSSLIQPPPEPIVHKAWAFYHPNPALPSLTVLQSSTTSVISNGHNARHCILEFPISNRGTCHGFAGYFETVLYASVELSTNPLTMDKKSEGMISWFPIYFPLKTPLYIPDNSSMTVQMWRQTDDRRVWYEWIVDVYTYIPIPGGLHFAGATTSTGSADQKHNHHHHHNHQQGNRKKIRIGGSELHSSEKEACLM